MRKPPRPGPIVGPLGMLALFACGSSAAGPDARSAGGDAGDPGDGGRAADTGYETPEGASSNQEASSPPDVDGGALRDGGAPRDGAAAGTLQHVFVVAMENHDSIEIYGDSTDAPYINGAVLSAGAHATNFGDELAHSVPSEPHYLWMEAATNTFADATFTTDADPSASNSTSSTAHLVTQIAAAGGAPWRTYQEGLNAATGACPIHSNAFYAAKHDPFVFFRDLSGSPPSATSVPCVVHHRPYSAFGADLARGDVAAYTFITPNLCNDMHGASGCPNPNLIASGDGWLTTELPPIIDYANTHAGVVFLTWDEGDGTGKMPFIVLGPTVKAGYAGSVAYTHASIVKSIEEILGLPILATAASASDLSDLFTRFP